MQLALDESKVDPYRQAGNQLLEQAQRGEIVDDETADKMTDLGKIVKTQFKKSEDARKALVKPLNDHVKFINGEFKKAQEPLVQAEKVAKSKLQVWISEKNRKAAEEAEAKRKAEEEKRLAEAEALQKEGKTEEADERLNEAVDIPVAKKTVAPQRGNYGGTASTRKVTKLRVVDLVKVAQSRPDLITVNEQAAIKEIRAGQSIPGLEIYEDETVVIR